jgi:6-phosphogluconolactonase
MTTQDKREIIVYVGAYTRREAHVLGKSEGIYVYRLDLASGAMTYASKITGVENPSFLALHPNCRYLYAVNEVGDFGGHSSGAVSAFSMDRQTGALTFLNQQPTQGAFPCHLSVDATGRCVLAANSGGGSVCVLPIGNDGRLGAPSDFIQHEGSSVNPQRQAGPHAHSITVDPSNRYVFAADLGLDKILIYALDSVQGKLKPNHEQPWARVKTGAGPRHFAFHPSRKYAYVINEIGSTMTAFAYDETRGVLHELQTLSTLPENFEGRSHTADVHVHPSGKFVYGSNRGHDSIAIFTVDEKTGKLTLIGHESTQGKTPRNFAIDPTGAYLLAANQNTDNIVIFRIDARSGKLTPTGHTLQTPTPVCLKFLT